MKASPEKYFDIVLSSKCGSVSKMGGYQEDVLDFMLDEIFPAVNAKVKEEKGSSLSKDRKRTSVVGYSLGGIFSCYAA